MWIRKSIRWNSSPKVKAPPLSPEEVPAERITDPPQPLFPLPAKTRTSVASENNGSATTYVLGSKS